MAASEPEVEAADRDGSSMLRELRQVAEQHGSCDVAASEDQLQALVSSLSRAAAARQEGGQSPAPGEVSTRSSSLLVEQPAVPPSLSSLWREGQSWHFSHGHLDVFGFNVFSPGSVKDTTVQIFGDLECRDDWLEHMRQHQPQQPSVAGPGWLCIASLSEYDYLFCCFDSASAHFGRVRHMVNNCCEEWACCDDAMVLVQRLLTWHSNGAGQETLHECSPRPPPPNSR